MEILETVPGEVRLFTDDGASGFKIYDFQNATVEIVSPPNSSPEQLGLPVKGVTMEGMFAICYKSDIQN